MSTKSSTKAADIAATFGGWVYSHDTNRVWFEFGTESAATNARRDMKAAGIDARETTHRTTVMVWEDAR